MGKRLDAQRNYTSLLVAAEQVFATHSPHAPLQLVAEAAGVGRGTLYRHFPDRTALVAAIYEARLDRYESFAAEHQDDPSLLFRLLRKVAMDQMRIPGMFRIINANSESSPEVASLWARTVEVFRGPLEASIRSGRVRPEVGLQDLFLSISMLYGVANSPSTFDHDEAVVERSLAILEHGLGSTQRGEIPPLAARRRLRNGT